MSEEKDCPFCGSECWGIFGPSESGEMRVECSGDKCGDWCFTPNSKDFIVARAEASAAWNRRAAPPAQSAPDDAEVIAIFEAAMRQDPEAYLRPDECIYQITSGELIRATRNLLARTAAQGSDTADLRAALKGLSDMYADTWDLCDGGLMMFEESIPRFEAAHAAALKALGIEAFDLDAAIGAGDAKS